MNLGQWNDVAGIMGLSLGGMLLIIWRATQYWRKWRLTVEAKMILKAAKETGEIYVLSGTGGSWLRAGPGADFFSPGDPAYTARFIDAFEMLLARKLVRHQEGQTYRLTGRGFQIAKRMQGV